VQISDDLKMEARLNEYLNDSIMIHNPKIKEMELTIEALKAQERVAQKIGLPQLGIGLDYAFVSERTDVNIPNNGKNAFMPMVTMSIPIFRKKYRSAVEETQLLQTAMEYKIKGMENRLISQYEVAYYEIEKALQLANLYEIQLFKTQQVLNLLYTDYGNSGKDFEEVLRMQQQLLKYQMAQATVSTQYYIALAQLEYITAKSE
jgi:cobalt-zinc-cadmium efflux system outer membrane protein